MLISALVLVAVAVSAAFRLPPDVSCLTVYRLEGRSFEPAGETVVSGSREVSAVLPAGEALSIVATAPTGWSEAVLLVTCDGETHTGVLSGVGAQIVLSLDRGLKSDGVARLVRMEGDARARSDVDGSGAVDINDIVILTRLLDALEPCELFARVEQMAAGGVPFNQAIGLAIESNCCEIVAYALDVNGDGSFGSADFYLALEQALFGSNESPK